MRFKDKICIPGYDALCRRYKELMNKQYHIAFKDSGRGHRAYLCGCFKSIRIGKRWIHPGRYVKNDGFHLRSRFNIGRFWKD